MGSEMSTHTCEQGEQISHSHLDMFRNPASVNMAELVLMLGKGSGEEQWNIRLKEGKYRKCRGLRPLTFRP